MQRVGTAFFLIFFLTNLGQAAETNKISAQTEVWFSPEGGARKAVLESVASAKKEILVGAYKLEDAVIAQALVDAHKRGIDVLVLLDKKKSRYKTSLKKWLLEQHVPVFVDSEHFLYHNKVIIIDQETVITGSFNFKADAETSNAENLLRLHSSKLAQKYRVDWKKHQKHSAQVKHP